MKAFSHLQTIDKIKALENRTAQSMYYVCTARETRDIMFFVENKKMYYSNSPNVLSVWGYLTF